MNKGDCLSKYCWAHRKCSKKGGYYTAYKAYFTIPALHVLLFYKFPQNEATFLILTLASTIIFGI